MTFFNNRASDLGKSVSFCISIQSIIFWLKFQRDTAINYTFINKYIYTATVAALNKMTLTEKFYLMHFTSFQIFG